MSESESFLSRWSRRKHDAEREAKHDSAPQDAPSPAPDVEQKADESDREDRTLFSPDGDESSASPAFHISSLPSIESITASTDIRDFLRPGVPAELSRAALRRVWSTDPAIRDFIGLSENAWDFTDTNDILGFGPLKATDDIRRLVAEVFGDQLETMTGTESAPDLSAAQQMVVEPPTASDSAADETSSQADEATSATDDCEKVIATQYKIEADQAEHHGQDRSTTEVAHVALQMRRAHGRALPE